MQTPAPLAGPPDLLHTSEAATPGASVAAVRGEHDHVLETPEFDTPGQASPARHRSLGDGAAALDSSRGRSGGLHAAAVAALADAVAAPAAAAEPLSKPRLRVQGADIILEDAASPKDAAENGGGPAQRLEQQQVAAAAAAGAPGQAAGAAAGGAGASASAAAQQPAVMPTQQQQQQQQQVQPPPLNLAAAMRVSQTHEHELQLRLASRTATGVSNMAIASTRAPITHPLAHGDDSRLRGLDAVVGGGGGEAGPASGGSSAVEGPVRIKYRSTLTEENVAYLNKLDQYASRPDATGRSSERIWRWLEGSGPPFDNPPPSLGVPTVSKTNLAATSRRQGAKRSFFSCFNCFGGGAQ
ncbi:hypothetical protein C2E21_4385 [Chlorella sorokiniana]|uniref:Uncharacterized protein n=1 Tax=Chlorella sorokiniana TaxID=3076 RepID=A0A2P6TS47_CHLSO|nr:hypothetical protein C2E21_4385 [Chlorella sorokiniana]|eukprot:PRW56895.1 hypothetical protein C2E21_4385 [Chlorella sorokiniana]